LLYGPPGTGKTMLAMAASNLLKATFINVSVDRVLSRYVGDSPRMISAIFRLAYRRAPSIVFFDEVETLVAKRDTGREAATGLVQTFLTELDGFKSKKLDKPVIVMAATNKPWMLDEAILSRFEKRIYIPLPDREARREIFRLNIEGKGLRLEGITLDELADMTEGYSGRDIANACREATMMMLRRANPDIYKRLEAVGSLAELQTQKYRVEPIRREEILAALKKVKPPITREELRRYEEWAKR
ncbi:MAG: ATP-binding protein, partial [Desulfurococcales archaeon]|nr:ATP-binding protein [Desulfurococcales archaeon]